MRSLIFSRRLIVKSRRQQGPPKRRYPATSLHGVTTHKMQAARTSEKLVSCHYTVSQPRRQRNGISRL